VLVVLCVLLLAGCIGTTPEVTLRGAVTDSYTGEMLGDAQVQIGETQLTTNANGIYQTAAWSAEDTLEISAPGYEPVQVPLAPHAPALDEMDDLPEYITVTLETALRPTVLEGVVLDAYTNEPIAGAQVMVVVSPTVETAAAAAATDAGAVDETGTVTATDALSGTLTATTNEQGRYSLEGLPESFTLLVNAPDYALVEAELARVTEHDVTLRPNVLSGAVTDQYSDEPIAGAQVQVGNVATTTGTDGTYRLEGVPAEASEVEFDSNGYETVVQPLGETTAMDAVLRPNQLSGVLRNQESGEPVQFATIIATETPTSTALASVRIDNQTDGAFTLDGLPESGYLQVLAPGYRKAVLDISPGNIPSEIALEPFYARALYIKTTTAAYLTERMESFYDLIDRTRLNALVIDLKSDNLADLGLIYYDSQVPIIQELGTSADIMDIRGILAEAKRRNIYTIARIHVFSHDNLLAETMPEWAAQNALGCVPNENRKCNGDVFYADWDVAWLDPWNRNVWDYNIQLGIEAAQLGFDEIQFDYIRFPSDASQIEHMRLSGPQDWTDPEEREAMFNNIVEVMTQAHEAFNDVGAFFSVDIFGYAVWAPQANIGQSADRMAPHADYIYPMVYPSHFWVNELGFENAAAHPYEIVYESMEYGNAMTGGKRAQLRPWLQDFTLVWVPDHLIVEYGVAEVQAQIQAAEDSPYTAGWAVWDPDNEYTIGAFRPE
jgi:hypothetical protein